MALSGIENHGMETTAFTVATQPVRASPPQGLNQAQTCSMMAASKRWSRMNWQSDALTALKQDVPFWSYFCQISDAVTSYGGYSGAVPNEKITWYKLSESAPKFMIQSDASIVAPLVFAYVLGW